MPLMIRLLLLFCEVLTLGKEAEYTTLAEMISPNTTNTENTSQLMWWLILHINRARPCFPIWGHTLV